MNVLAVHRHRCPRFLYPLQHRQRTAASAQAQDVVPRSWAPTEFLRSHNVAVVANHPSLSLDLVGAGTDADKALIIFTSEGALESGDQAVELSVVERRARHKRRERAQVSSAYYYAVVTRSGPDRTPRALLYYPHASAGVGAHTSIMYLHGCPRRLNDSQPPRLSRRGHIRCTVVHHHAVSHTVHPHPIPPGPDAIAGADPQDAAVSPLGKSR